MKKEMEGYLGRNKESKKIEMKEREEIDQFWNSEQMKELVKVYESQLNQMYKYYTLQGNIPLQGNVEKRMNVIEFNNWVKMGYNTNITPHLISGDDMVTIYRIVEREMDQNCNSEQKEVGVKYRSHLYLSFYNYKKLANSIGGI